MLRLERLLLASLAISLFTVLPARANLIITPTFDASITSDPNSVAIEAAVNAAINLYEVDFSDPINVSIDFQEVNTGLGQSNTTVYNIPYTTFYNALVADAKSSDDATALAHLPAGPNSPVLNSPNINLDTANIKALAIPGSFPSTLAGGFDGIVSLNTSAMNLSRIGPQDPTKFDLQSTAEHMIDEVLGLGSTLITVPNHSPFPEDLFRYSANGSRSFTSDGAPAFFSIDGATDLAEFNDQNFAADFGDWRAGAALPQVQDDIGTAGAQPDLGVELRALDVIGYDLAVPEPASGAMMIVALGFMLLGARKFKSSRVVSR